KRYCTTTDEAARAKSLRIIAAFVVCASVVSYFVVPLTAWCAVPKGIGPLQPRLISFVTVGVAAGMMGAVLPLVAFFGIDADDRAGLNLGYVYLANIIGSALGSLLTGFVLMEIASTRGISVGLALGGFAMAFGLLVMSGLRGGELAKWGGAIAGAAVVVIASSTFAFDGLYERLLRQQSYDPNERFAEVVENRHGVIAIGKDLEVYGGGVYDGAINTSLVDDKNKIERAYAVAVLHPHPKQMLVIGMSTGAWAQVLVELPGVEHMTIVEIDPGYLDIIPKYPVVASLLTNPKVDIVIDDGRRWLLRHPERKFDAIVMNTSFHWRSHMTNLLSREFLLLVREHLLPGGLHYYNTTNSDLVQHTACVEYPYAMRFENFMAVSDSPMPFDRDAWCSELETATIGGKPALDLSNPEEKKLLEHYVGILDAPKSEWASVESRESILARTQGMPEVTDDNMAAEWHPQQ
ncbi:MAG TPA: fused MFS/spermidine synthase, partial [Polyangiaceae bacterium]